jgi:hypothetical protein
MARMLAGVGFRIAPEWPLWQCRRLRSPALRKGSLCRGFAVRSAEPLAIEIAFATFDRARGGAWPKRVEHTQLCTTRWEGTASEPQWLGG